MKTIILPIMLLVAVMSSCSKEVAISDNEGGLREIRLSSGISAQTKAVYDGDVAVSGLQFLRKDATATTDDFSGAVAFSGKRDVGGVITFGATRRYLASGNTYIASYFPVGQVNNNEVVWDIDGKTDIMTASTVDCGTNAAPISSASLTYKHQLAQIEVICKAATNGDERTRWGKVKSISMVNTPATASYAYNGQVVSASTTLKNTALLGADYTTNLSAFDIQPSNGTEVNAAGMFYALTSQIFELRIETENGGTKTVTIDLGFGNTLTQGKKHKVTLTFQPTTVFETITVGSTIEAWTNGANGTGSVD